jgi:hypothetical protein
MMIGIDFDNTIACYDRAFAQAARDMGLIAETAGLDKRTVRERVRGTAGETAWMRLQGRVYGFYIEQAEIFDGFADFVRAARTAGCAVCVISHKSQFGHFDPDRIDLIDAARGWMRRRGFFSADGLGFAEADTGFYPSRADKLQAIAEFGCDVFIDDLSEVLLDPAFPPACRAVLFDPSHAVGWAEIGEAVLT